MVGHWCSENIVQSLVSGGNLIMLNLVFGGKEKVVCREEEEEWKRRKMYEKGKNLCGQVDEQESKAS